MAVVVDPAGGLFAVLTLTQPVGLVIRPWEPNAEPVPIAPGELDTVETALRRIYWQWHGTLPDGSLKNWTKLGTIIGTAWQSTVDEHFQIDQFRFLATAFGATVDEIGALVSLLRFTADDGLYKQAIKARGASTVGDAGIDAVMRPAKVFLGATNVSYLPAYPRGFCYIVLVALDTDLLALLADLIRAENVAPCGVGSKIVLAPPESPGWDWSTPQAWAGSWSSAYGVVDLSVVAPWGWSLAL